MEGGRREQDRNRMSQRERERRAYRRRRAMRRRRTIILSVTVLLLALVCAGVWLGFGKDLLQKARGGNSTAQGPVNQDQNSGQMVSEHESSQQDASWGDTQLSEENEDGQVSNGNEESQGNLPSFDENEEETEDRAAQQADLLEGLYSPYAVLVDLASGQTLAERNSSDRMYPASMTKIMTAILAIEEAGGMDRTVTVPYEIYAALWEEGASMAGFEAGEQASVEDLVYGVLLPSGAECCITLAELVSGSESAFVEQMNQKADELGMENTHFCNTTGLHDADHYTTASDIAVLLQYALKNDEFRNIFTKHRYSTRPTDQHPDGFTFYSTMFQSLGDGAVTGGEILGGKTGYTEEAGLCLASLAQVNGKDYILVTAGAPGSHDTEPMHTIDAKTVYSRIGERGL